MGEKMIRVKLKGCVVYLTTEEINSLLLKDINLFKIALKRGKAIERSYKQRQREEKKLTSKGDAVGQSEFKNRIRK